MPGLVGCVGLDSGLRHKVDTNLITAMRDAITHRDWYKTDDYVNRQGTVAISRVNLNVINRDRQPYLARGGRLKVFLHGEINNDEVAHANPLEFICRLYERDGWDFAAGLNGSFVVVIVDEDEDAVLIANDRIASKPLFLFKDGRAVYFGPEMKSLFLIPSLERKLNLAAVADFLSNGFFTTGHTFVEGLEWMDGATVLKIARGSVTSHKYWEWELRPDRREKSPEYYQEALVALLRQAFRRSLRVDATYGVLLSGGHDSRGILGFYLEQKNDRQLKTISWGREEDTFSSDCAIARRMAQGLGADHRFYRLTAEEVMDTFHEFILLGEGLTWNLWPYDVFHKIREEQGVDVILRGDQCFGNSASYLMHDERTILEQLGLSTLEDIEGYRRALKPHYHRLFCQLDAETTRRVSSRCQAKHVQDRRDFLYLDVRVKYYLNPLNYVKSYAVESFRPLLDNDLLDFVAQLPISYRAGKSLWKRTIAETFPELMSEEIARVRNDVDWAASFRGSAELERWIYGNLTGEENAVSEFLDRDGLTGLLDAFFAAPADVSSRPTLRGRVAQRIKAMSPTVFHHAHKSFYRIKQRLGQPVYGLPVNRVIIRLLVLKAWGDVFLNYPVVRTAD